jgi:hypothetical protein
MARKKAAGRKRKEAPRPAPGRRAERLQKALAAALEREAKAASRLEARQLEVAVLRAALAEVLAQEAPAPVAAPPADPPPATRRRRPSRPAADR